MVSTSTVLARPDFDLDKHEIMEQKAAKTLSSKSVGSKKLRMYVAGKELLCTGVDASASTAGATSSRTVNADNGVSSDPEFNLDGVTSCSQQKTTLPRKKRRRLDPEHGSTSDEGALRSKEALGVAPASMQKEAAGNNREEDLNDPCVQIFSPASEQELSEVELQVKDPFQSSTAFQGASDVDWRCGLEELRRTYPRKPRALSHSRTKERPETSEFVQLVQTAIEKQDWTAITDPAFAPRQPEMVACVKELSENELLELLRVVASHHEAQPRARWLCCNWMTQVLEHASCSLAGRPQLRMALRPLLEALDQRLPPMHNDGQALACLARWRLVAELARDRRGVAALQGAAAAAMPFMAIPLAQRTAATAEVSGEPASSDEEDHEDEAAEAGEAASSDKDNDAAAGGGEAEVKASKVLAGGAHARAPSGSCGQRGSRRQRLRSRR